MGLKLYFSIFAAVFTTLAQAAEATFSLDEVTRVALANNLDLQAAELRIAEAKAQMDRAGRLPNPEFETGVEPNLRGREYAVRVGFTQKFPVTARLRIEKEVSRLHLLAARAELQTQKRNLASEALAAGVQVAALSERHAVQESHLATARQLASLAGEAARVGEAPQAEASQFALVASQAELHLLDTKGAYEEARKRLATVMSLRGGDSATILGNLPPTQGTPQDAPAPEALLEGARQRARAAAVGIQMARTERWQDVSVGVFGGVEEREDRPAGIQQEQSAGLVVSIPLPLWSRDKGRLREAEAAAARAQKEIEALEFRTQAEAGLALSQMKRAAQAVEMLTEKALPKAREAEAHVRLLQKEGQASHADLLRVHERLLELQTAEIDARRDYHVARAQLLKFTGSVPGGLQ